jgi:hypothetical protein
MDIFGKSCGILIYYRRREARDRTRRGHEDRRAMNEDGIGKLREFIRCLRMNPGSPP